MGIKINEYPIEGTDINDDSYIDVDQWNGTGYESNKLKWLTVLSTAIRGFAKLASNNIFTGTNQFNKQVKIKSDGTNSPLVVKDSTDLNTIGEFDNNGWLHVRGNGNDGKVLVRSNSGNYYPSIQLLANGTAVDAGIRIMAYDTNRLVFQGQLGLDVRMYSDTMTINDDPNLYTKACFVVTSTTKGVLIPRLTTTQRNAMGGTLPTSLLIFNSTANQYEFWNGSAWTGLGDINNASNVGAVGSGIFKDKTGQTLNFRKLVNAGGIGVAINGDNVELTNQHVNIVDMNDTFFGTLVTNDLIQYDGGSWVNVQPYDIYKVNATVNTTNNTLTLLKAYTLSDGIHQMELDITGFETATGNTYTGRFFPNVRVVSGVATLVNTFNDFAQVGVLGFSTGGGFGVSASLSTNVLSINVTGKNATNITWNIKTIKL